MDLRRGATICGCLAAFFVLTGGRIGQGNAPRGTDVALGMNGIVAIHRPLQVCHMVPTSNSPSGWAMLWVIIGEPRS